MQAVILLNCIYNIANQIVTNNSTIEDINLHLIFIYMNVKEKIVFAIVGKYKISLVYQNTDTDKPDEYKSILPHLIGVHKTTGKCILSAYYQPENKPLKPCWKSFILDNILSVELSDEKFNSPQQGYNPNDSRMKTVLAFITQ